MGCDPRLEHFEFQVAAPHPDHANIAISYCTRCKIRILGDDDQSALGSERPNVVVGCWRREKIIDIERLVTICREPAC